MGVLVGAVALASVGCSTEQPGVGFDADAAEAVFVECAAGFGVEVTGVRIEASGDLSVQVSDDAPRDGVEKVQAECEPAAFAAGGGPDAGDGEPQLPPVPDGVEDVDDYLEVLRDQGFSGAMLVEQGAAVVTSAALGAAATDPTIDMTTGTAFDVGSIAKLFTAVAVLELVDAGELSLDDPLGELLRGVPEDKEGITVRQLLDFTSGLREYHDTEGDFEEMGKDEARDIILGQDLLFEPGTDTAYSNSSYTLAAIVVSEVTGRDFTDVVSDLFTRAGLTHTGFYGSQRLQDIPVARSREGRRAPEGNDPAQWTATWALLGSGGIVSSVEDLHRFWDQLREPRLLSAEATEVLFEAVVPSQTIEGSRFRGVSGANDFGFETFITELPAEDLLVIVATNANPPERTMASDAAFVLAQLATSEDGPGR